MNGTPTLIPSPHGGGKLALRTNDILRLNAPLSCRRVAGDDALMAPFTPSYLPHQGGGLAPLVELDWATATGFHLPTRVAPWRARVQALDGGGREGVADAKLSGGRPS